MTRARAALFCAYRGAIRCRCSSRESRNEIKVIHIVHHLVTWRTHGDMILQPARTQWAHVYVCAYRVKFHVLDTRTYLYLYHIYADTFQRE